MSAGKAPAVLPRVVPQAGFARRLRFAGEAGSGKRPGAGPRIPAFARMTADLATIVGPRAENLSS
jgi:hypothetical protein